MKKTLFLLFSLNCFAQSPTIDWSVNLGGLNNDELRDIIEIPRDNTYVFTGSSSSTDGDFAVTQGNSDLVLAKVDATGGIIWAKTYGGSGSEDGSSVYETTDGGFIICGSTDSNNGDVLSNHGFLDIWVIKTDENGNLEWQQTYGGSAQDNGYVIRPTSDGGYIIGGLSRSTNGDATNNKGESDYWIIKIAANGAIQWQKNYGGSDLDVLSSIEQTADGGFIMNGTVFSTNVDVTNHHGGADYWVVKTNSLGVMQWQKTLGGSHYEFAGNIQQTADGGYIVSGSSPSIDGDVTNNHGQGDLWIVKLNPLGVIDWQKTFGGTLDDKAYFVEQTSDGGFIITGISNSVDGDLLLNNGLYDYWVLKVNAAGVAQWQKTIGGSNNDYADCIKQSSNNGFIVGGRSYSADIDVPGNNGNGDVFILKLSPDTLNNDSFIQADFVIFPNPAKSELNIQTSNNAIFDRITVTDMLGKIILQQTSGANSVDVQNLANGVYVLQAYSGKDSYQRKFIKE